MTINATVASTISKQCYNTSNECNNYYYSYPSEYNMDIPLHSYMYTLFLGIGCYSLLNPTFMRRMMVNIGFSIANALLGGFIIYNEHIYKPFNKYIYKPLVYILNIQEKEDEIMIIKDGVVIHSFKTMDDFIKQQPINFVCDEEDEDEDDVDEDDEGSSEEENSNQETIVKGEGDENKSSNNESDGKIVDTIIDADLTQVSTDIHESEPGDGENENKSGDEDEDEDDEGSSEEENSNQETIDKGDGDENKSSNNESDGKIVDTIIDADLTQLSTDIHESEPGEGDGEGENESEKEEEEDDEDDFILDPSEYDFLLRNVYYENEKESERFCVSLKYETFCKSDTKKVFTTEELKTQLSKRKLIAINLHMNSKKYSINLTTPVNYFTVENSILGYHFLKWYMAQTYDVMLDNKYTVLCIDNFVGMYKIKPGKKLVIYSDSLKVVDDDEYSEDNDNDDDDDDNDDDNDDHDNDNNDDNNDDNDDNDDNNNNDDEHLESNNQDKQDEPDKPSEQTKTLDQLNDACDIEVVDCH